MIKRVVLVSCILSIAWALLAVDILSKVLPNGMEVIVRRDTTSQSVGMICVVKTGSMHEGRLMGSGISHYLEHVVSGGSTLLHSEDYYSQKDKEIGAVTNAFTSFDKTAYHTLVNKEHFSNALQMLAEHIQFCSFDSLEVAREKQVIAKEIVMGSTPPYSQMYWRYRTLLYDGTNMKYNPIGNADLFLKLERSDLVDYYNRRYVPNNMIVIVNGNIDKELAMREVETVFAGFDRRPLEPIIQPSPKITQGSFTRSEEFEINLPLVFIDQIIPASGLQDYYALDALADILINKKYSPIQKKLYEEMQLVNYIYSSVNIDHSTSTLDLQIGFEAKETAYIQKIIDILYRELSKYKNGYFRQEQLDNLIQSYEADHLMQTPDVQDHMIEMCDTMIDYGVPGNYSETIADRKRVLPSDLNAMVKKYYTPANKLTFMAIPRGQMNLLYDASVKPIISSELKKSDMGNGLTLIHKQNTQNPIVRGTVIIPGGTDYEDESNSGNIEFMINLLLKGSKKYSAEKLANWQEEHSADISIYAGRDDFVVSFSCLTADLPEMRKILVDAIAHPEFSELQIGLLKDEYNATALRDMSNPGEVHNEYRSKMIYSNKREQMGIAERNAVVRKIERQDLVNTYKKYLKAPMAIIAITGDQTESQAKELAKAIYGAFDHHVIDDKLKPLQVEVKNATYSQEYPFEQVNIDINMKAPSCHDTDYYAMKVLETILGGSHGRIFQATRGDNDLAYFAYAQLVSEVRYGYLRVTSQTSYEKANQLRQVLLCELDRIIREPVSKEEITSAIEADYVQRQNLITDKHIGHIAASNESKGLGYDYWFREITELRRITPEDVQRVAMKYLKDRDVIISIPSKDVNRIVGE